MTTVAGADPADPYDGPEGAVRAVMAAVDERRAARAAAETPAETPAPDPPADPPEGMVTHTAMTATGASYRQVDYWTRRGYLHAENGHPGSGYRRLWPVDEQRVCALIVRLLGVGIDLHLAVRVARDAVARDTTYARLGDGVHIAWTPRGLPA